MPDSDWTLRPMNIGDFDAVINLWRDSEGVGLNESDTRPQIEAYLARNPGMSFVAHANGRLVGAVLCGHDGRRGYLHHLAVNQDFRRQGIGRALVDAALTSLKQIDILKCNIFLYADNKQGGLFWTHNGWRDRADLRLLQKPLTANPSGCGW
jgi:N-acetylglutamate synthase